MKKVLFPSLCVVVLFLITDCSKTNDDYVSLFNGTNLDGWYAKIRSNDAALANKVFSVHNEAIHVYKDFPEAYELNTGENNTHGMLYTKDKYSKFILKFEYKWGKGIANNFDKYQYDAGVYYHVVDDKIWPKGIEYQVRYNHITNRNHTGDFWAPKIDWYSLDGKTYTPKEKGGKLLVKPGEHLGLKNFENYQALNNEWNQCEIIVMGNTYVIHKLNGDIVNMATNLPNKEGLIGFQAETAEILYRNIKIKVFEENIPMDHFLN
ncbi:3-keto-disaccharide hydrolase [Seonamhaeicola marinus]|nr:DUF1080 domain-containing protein [Seonamhaeicola marinus]